MAKEKKEEQKVGVSYIAQKLGIEDASARVRLRNAGIEKGGRSYEWSQAEADKIVAQLKRDEPKEEGKKGGAKQEDAPKKGKQKAAA